MTLPLEQFAALCKEQRVEGFLNLRELLPSDLEAAKALRVETAFVQSPEFRALEVLRSNEFGKAARQYLLTNKLEWNAANLLAACRHVLFGEKP